ncbi:hypothetical protein [Streptomyces sp. NBC_00525]|uniref:hypothetical protein n=1 Tax=Streptomyces sp. NBC_00525 TaxID=2903660 RepID=UPI002E8086CC|nr:hypothetical protein [Streptomyces sp. NBC_00525]WUC92928.1 hypothetical protein OG710_04610 [Streptomyces sp. NBC_00525]
MKFITGLGDTLLRKLVPETEAQAACVTCGTGCTSYKQYKCEQGMRLFARCCYMANGSNCTAPYCGSWSYCGFC